MRIDFVNDIFSRNVYIMYDVVRSIYDLISSIKNRDELDSTRTHSPLLKAKDAISIDTTHLTINEQIEKIVAIINKQ